jgi:hypothetical protein
MAQMRFVWFVQHCVLAVQDSPSRFAWHRHRFLCVFAAVSDLPTPRIVAAIVAAPRAAWSALRRVLPPPRPACHSTNSTPFILSSESERHFPDAPAERSRDAR